MSQTTIEWTRGADGSPGHTVNPLRARLRSDLSKVGHYCEKVSPGCDFCYSSRWQPRRHLPQFSGTHGRGLDLVEPFLDVRKLDEVLRRRKPTVWFWADMTDMFGRWVTNEQIAACFGVMAATPWHTHQVLTKRAERLPEWFGWLEGGAERLAAVFPADSLAWRRGHMLSAAAVRAGVERAPFAAAVMDAGWPLPNVWLGVSVEDQQRADERIPHLLATPAAVRFLSCEPLLGPIDLRLPGVLKRNRPAGFDGWPEKKREEAIATAARAEYIARGESISWCIAGGESGPGARPMDLAWMRSIMEQCAAAAVPYFAKQLGAKPFNSARWGIMPDGSPPAESRISLKDRKGGDPAEWPEDLRVRQMPEVPRG